MTAIAAVVAVEHDDPYDIRRLQETLEPLADTPYVVVRHPAGKMADAVNNAVAALDSKWVAVLTAGERPCEHFTKALETYAFAAQVVYGGTLIVDPSDGSPLHEIPPPLFCPYRIRQEPFISSAAIVEREKFLEVGGIRDGFEPVPMWDVYRRGSDAGWRFKVCPEAWIELPADHEQVLDGVGWLELVERLASGENSSIPATFYYQATYACAYLRCLVPARHLPAVATGTLLAAASEDDLEFPLHHGNAVLQFPGDKTWAVMMMALQQEGMKVLVDVDDNYLANPGKLLRGASRWGDKIGDAMHTFQGHRWITKNADGAIVTTNQLAAAYRKANKNVFVIPNPVDPADWAAFNRPHDDGIFRIGWFASKSHIGDDKLIRRGLEWASKQPGVEVIIMGLNPNWPFKYTAIPWVNDLDQYRAAMFLIDVGLAPVIPNRFSIFRSDIKASEYAMGGAAVVASDVPPYDDWTDGTDCLKVSDAKGWFHAIKHLVKNKDEAKELAAAGREFVRKNREIEQVIGLWRQALEV